MEISDFRQLGSIFFAFFGGAALMYAIATVVVGRGGARQSTAHQRKLAGKKKRAQIEKDANEALLKPTQVQVAFSALQAHLEADVWPDWLGELRALAQEVLQARVTRETGVLEDRILPSPLDVLLSGPTPDRLGAVHIGAIRLVKANALPTGASATVRLHLLVEEHHGDDVRLVEALEDWMLGWPPGSKVYRVIGVDRRWRRRVDPPVLNQNPQRPSTKLMADPELTADHETLQGWDFEAEVARRVEAWMTDTELDLHADGHTQRALAHHRLQFFGCSLLQRDVAIQTVTPARFWQTPTGALVSFQVIGRAHRTLTSPQATVSTDTPYDWVYYATLWCPDEGPRQLAWLDDESLWAV